MYINKFMYLCRILVNETSKEHPLTAKQILDKMEKGGHRINNKTFYSYVKRLKEAGIIIKRTNGEYPYFYYYSEGWI